MTFSNWKWFVETTSLKGVSRAAKTQPTNLKRFWVVAVVIFFISCIFQVALLLDEYFSYEVVVSSKSEQTDYSNPQVFPRVTLCNLHPFYSGDAAIYEYSWEFRKAWESATTCDDNCSEHEKKMFDIMKQLLDGPVGMTQYYGKTIMEDMGHDEKSQIVSCSQSFTSGLITQFIPCSESVTFKRHFHPHFLNCFSTSIPMRTDVDLGAPDGLSFMLFLDNLHGINASRPPFNPHYVAKTAGAKIELSAKTDIPLMGTKSILLNAGTTTVVVYTVTEYKALSSPYGTCIEYEDDQPSYQLGELCQTNCVTKFLQASCGCTDFTQGAVLEANESYPFCGNVSLPRETLLDYYDCTTKYRDDYACPTCYYQCYHPCRTFSFDTKTSSSAWPYTEDMESFWEYIVKNPIIGPRLKAHHELMVKEMGDIMDSFRIKEYIIQHNFLKVTIRMGGFEQLTSSESPKASFATLVSKVGAALNFWSGITVVLLVEIFELFYRMFAGNGSSKAKKVYVDEAQNYKQ